MLSPILCFSNVIGFPQVILELNGIPRDIQYHSKIIFNFCVHRGIRGWVCGLGATVEVSLSRIRVAILSINKPDLVDAQFDQIERD